MQLNRPSVKASGRPAATSVGSADLLMVERNGKAEKLTLEELAEALGLIPTNFYKQDTVLYVAHRGAALLYPEETMEAYRAAFAAGLRNLEMDVQSLSDGTQAVMHDTTVTATTTSTGNVSSFSPTTWKQLAIDANTWHGSNFGNALTPPLFAEILNEFKGRALIIPEAKASNGAQVVAALQAAGIPTSGAIVQSFDVNQLLPVVAAGYPALYLHTGDGDLSAALYNGFQWAGISKAATQQQITDWVASGVKTCIYTVNRRHERDAYLALGVHGFFTDDPLYLQESKPFSTYDRFHLQTWMPGMINFQESLGAAGRGRFFAPDWWGWDDTLDNFVLHGWACPIKGAANADNYTIDFTIQFNAVTQADRWASIFISDTDKSFSDSASFGDVMGYHCLVRKNGQMQIFKRGPAGNTTLNTQAGTAIDDGAEIRFRLTVTPTAVTFSRLNPSGSVLHSATTNDTDYRGGYFHLGHKGLACKFRQIIVR